MIEGIGVRPSGVSGPRGQTTTVTRRGFLSLAVATPAAAILGSSTASARPWLSSQDAAHWTLRIDRSALRPVQRSQLSGAFAWQEIGDGEFVSTGPVSTESFGLVAVSWPSEMPSSRVPRVLLRTRASWGWSEWHALQPDTHGPDEATAEAQRDRAASHPRIVEQSDVFELVLAAEDVPAGLDVHFVQAGDGAFSTGAAAVQPADPAQPTILTRADWGADETIREPGDPDYGQIRGAFVHHTAGLNSYSAGDVPAIIRSIYVYHVRTRGWRDIGYNFLIDKFGRIWEGRYGGISQPVVGAHTAGYNSSSFGAAVIGTYSSKVPEQAVLRAYRRLIAWKFSLHAVQPLTLVSYPDQDRLPAISGHRDTSATECPGQQLYDALPSLRREVNLAIKPGSRRTLVSPIGPQPVIPPTD